jgi:hypothetical protein
MLTTKAIKNQLRSGPYAWPGGYPIFFCTADGGALSFKTVLENWKEVCWAVRHNDNNGWQVVGCEVNWEDTELYDDHTGELIESAYGE